jgi:hypothetical protein
MSAPWSRAVWIQSIQGRRFVGVDRAGGADQQHRHAVAPGVEHGHGRVHETDVGMHRRRHRSAR